MFSTQKLSIVPKNETQPIIRLIHENDAEKLLAYYCCLAREPVNNTAIRRDVLWQSADSLWASLAPYGGASPLAMFVAEFNGEIVGMIKCERDAHVLTNHVVEISVNVHPQMRGKGIGRALIQHALDWMQADPTVTRVQLEVLTRNRDAYRLYERLGFEFDGVRRRAYRIPDEGEDVYGDVVVMALLLPAPGST